MNERTNQQKRILRDARCAMKMPKGPEREAEIKRISYKAFSLGPEGRSGIRLELARILVPDEETPIRTFNQMMAKAAIDSNFC